RVKVVGASGLVSCAAGSLENHLPVSVAHQDVLQGQRLEHHQCLSSVGLAGQHLPAPVPHHPLQVTVDRRTSWVPRCFPLLSTILRSASLALRIVLSESS